MSLTAITSATLGSSLYSLVASTSTDSSAAAVKIPATPASSAEAAQAKALAKDLDALLNALSSGDLSGAQVIVARLKNDIRAQQSGVITSPFDDGTGADTATQSDASPTGAADGSSQSPLGKLLSKLSDTLNSSGTEDALRLLASHLVQSGQNSGNLVNTNA